MVIRLLQETNIPEAAEIAQGVFGLDLQRTIADQNLIGYFYDYANEGNLTNRMRCGQVILWGVFDGPRMCGISAMQPEGHITMLYVYPAFRRRGYGKALLEAMRTFAYTQLHLEKVTVSAMPAWTTNYFTRCGFTVLSPQPHPEFVNLCIPAKEPPMYPVKKIPGKTVALVIVITVLLIFALAFGFLALYTPSV